MRKLLWAMLVVAAVGGCSNPETEAPVDLEPGLYHVTVGGGTVVQLRSGAREENVCFTPDNALAFPADSLSHLIAQWDGCATVGDAPKGNAIGGVRRCPGGDGYERKQSMTAVYSGSHDSVSFSVHGSVSQGSDEGGGVMRLGSGDFAITGKRIGDCQG